MQHRHDMSIKSVAVGAQPDVVGNASNMHLIDVQATDSGEEKQEEIAGVAKLAPLLPSSGFCRRHPCSLLTLSEGGKAQRGMGKTAKLNEDGYHKVAQLKDDEEMKDFIIRAIEKFDCKVEDMGGLMGMVPWFSGTVAEQSLAKLEEALLFAVLADGTPWVTYKNSAGTTGNSARLNLEGYVDVACMRNDEEMNKFARRLAKSMDIKITDEGGFEGTMKYYSGSATFQSFESMKSEFRAAAEAPHSWAKSE